MREEEKLPCYDFQNVYKHVFKKSTPVIHDFDVYNLMKIGDWLVAIDFNVFVCVLRLIFLIFSNDIIALRHFLTYFIELKAASKLSTRFELCVCFPLIFGFTFL